MIGAISLHVPQSPASHFIRERAHSVGLSAIDASYFEAVPPRGPVRFVDHHETRPSPVGFAWLRHLAGGFLPPALFRLNHEPSPIPRC
jgi:hypothetical protein